MSGIYIPNMEMPKACIIGKLPYYEYCPCFGGCSKASSKTERPSDCPLVELPTNGNWHTGTPTEDGWYLLKYEDGFYCANYWNGNGWKNQWCGTLLKWQKIEETE